MALAGLLLAGYVAVSSSVLDLPDEVVAGGWHWRAFAFDIGEGLVAVGASICVLAFAQRRWTSAGRFLREKGRSAYAAYVLQGIPLLGSALSLRAVDLPAEIKALVVAAAGVTGAFALGWVLVRKTQVGRIL